MWRKRWKAAMGGVVLLLWVMGPEAYEAWRGDQTVGWPRVMATVVSHELASPWPWEAGWWRRPRAEVTYRYQVEGLEYESGRVGYQGPAGELRASEALRAARANYPVGASVEARYDPSNPARAVLTAGAGDWGRVWRQGGIIAVVLLAFVVGDAVWKRVRD